MDLKYFFGELKELAFICAFIYLIIFKPENINNNWLAIVIISISFFILGNRQKAKDIFKKLTKK